MHCISFLGENVNLNIFSRQGCIISLKDSKTRPQESHTKAFNVKIGSKFDLDWIIVVFLRPGHKIFNGIRMC